MALVRCFIPSWRINLLLGFIVITCFSVSGLLLAPCYNQQVQNSGFGLMKSKFESREVQWQRDGHFASAMAPSNTTHMLSGVDNQIRKSSETGFTFGTTNSIPLQNVRAKRDANDLLETSSENETNGSLLPTPDAARTEAASEATTILAPTTEARWSSDLLAEKTTLTSSPLTVAASAASDETNLTKPTYASKTTQETYSTENTTPFFSSVEPSVCPEISGVNITEISDGKIRIDWSLIPENATDFQIVCVEATSAQNEACKKCRLCSTAKVTSETITDLCHFNKYNVSVSLQCDSDEWKKSIRSFETRTTVPSEPRNLQNRTVTSTTVFLTWSSPEFPNGIITDYKVYWSTSDSESSDTSQDTSCLVQGLKPYTNYTVSVSAWTKAGESKKRAGPLIIETLEGIPTEPRNLENGTVTDTTILLKWDPPVSLNGKISRYVVYWTSSDSNSSDSSQGTSFTMKKLTPYTNYTITVSAWTSAGESEKRAGPLTIQTEQGIPDPPEEVNITEITNLTLTVQWLPPNVSRGEISKYSVYWKKSSAEGNFHSEETSKRTLTLKNLASYSNYTVKVSAWTVAGQGPASKEVTGETLQGIPDPPEDVRFSQISDKTLTLKWSPPSTIKGVITNYTVYWKKLDSTEKHQSAVTDETTMQLKSLKPFSNYTVKVSAWTVVGEGLASDDKIQQTDEGIPDPPEDVRFSQVSDKTLTLKWSPPSIIKGVITNYTVYWKKLDSTEKHQSAVTDETTMQLKSLKPFSNYTVKVSAWTVVGEGLASDDKIQQTDEGIPGPPLKLNVADGTNVSLVIQWWPPEDPNGEIVKYDVMWSFWSEDNFVNKTNSTNETFFHLDDLTPNVNYTLSVSAWTSKGKGVSSDETHYQTDVGVPSQPKNVSIIYRSSDALTLSWEEPEYPRGAIDGYVISWKRTEEVKFSNSTDTRNGRVSMFEAKELTPFTNYTFYVTPYNINRKKEVLMSESSGIVEAQTKEDIPTPPRDFHVEAFTDTTFDVAWQDPETPNGVILVYTVYWQSADGSGEMNQTNTTVNRYVISNLKSFTKYNLRVSATTIAGEGPPTAGQQQKTDVGEPSAPRNGTVLYVNDTSILVEWKKPEFEHGPIHGFTVCWRKWLSNGESNATDLADSCHDFRPAAEDSCDDLNEIFAERGGDQNATVPACRYYIFDLDPWTNYSVEIKAYNKNQHRDVLEGPPEVIRQATEAAVPEEPFLNHLHVLSSTAVSIGWTYAGRFPGPLSYVIYLEPDFSDSCPTDDFPRNVTRGLGNGTANVASLRPFTSYRFQVFASTPAGSSSSQKTKPVRTKPAAPEQPTNVRVNCSYSPTKASVSWTTPNRANGLIEEYKIRYRSKDGENFDVIKADESTPCDKREYEAELQNLHPEKTYEISVVGKTKDVSGYGEYARSNGHCLLPAGVPPFPYNDTVLDVKETSQDEALFAFSEAAFSTEMGEIRYYAIIVGFSHVIGMPTNGSTDEATSQKFPFWNQFWKQASEIYQATPENWNPFRDKDYDPLHCRRDLDSEGDLLYCTIGSEKNCSEEKPTYCNGPLKPGKRYGIKLRGFTAGGFSETSPIFISTASVETGSPVGVIVGLVFVSLFVLLIAVAVFLDKRNNYKMFNRMRSLFIKKESSAPGQNLEIGLHDTSTSNAAKTIPMDFATFLEHVKVMMSDSFLRFSLEYEEIKQNSPKHPCTAAEMDENRTKNRWMNIFPFDHSRVKLLPIDDEPSSDYINANYIPGFTSHREYIATQGPLPSTVDDFWRMVWEQGVTMIVMLTQCVERGKKKCEQYWPSDSDSVYYGDLKIQLKSESILSAYCIRIFDLQLGNKQHTVKQMHFTKWPDFGSPESPEDLINFVQAVRDHLPHTNTGPILVHCSAGVGRTGTFIAVDRLLQHIQYYNEINIYNTVVEMRHYRTNMVQTEDQYIYIHKCMRDILSQKLNPRGSIYDDEEENLYSNLKTTEL